MDAHGEKTLWPEIAGVLFIAWTILISIIWLGEGRMMEKKVLQKEAVLKGAAEYVVDESGNPVFQWKENK